MFPQLAKKFIICLLTSCMIECLSNQNTVTFTLQPLKMLYQEDSDTHIDGIRQKNNITTCTKNATFFVSFIDLQNKCSDGKIKKMIPVPVGAGTRIGGHIYNTTSSYRIIAQTALFV